MITVVIPALNEEKALPATLDSILSQQGDFEIIVVDGGSTDNTVTIAKKHDGVQVLSSAAGRARQMNAGAAVSKGEWVLFLHADAILPTDAFTTILNQEHDVQAGGFRHRFSGQAWGLKLVSWLHNYRCQRTGVLYGDQAMFIRQHLFKTMGGFPEVNALEDLLFGEQLVKHTTPVLLPDTVLSDSRKFEQKGIWISLFRVILIQVCHELKLPVPTRKFFASVR